MDQPVLTGADLTGGLDDVDAARRACDKVRNAFLRLRHEVGRVIVGQRRVVDETLVALFANGHVLLEGVPGLGKTLLVRTLADALTLPFNRIQFTPDIMPADITGTTVVVDDPQTGHRTLHFNPGPIFSQFILADEINRATPRSQSALLEAMQERSVTVAGTTHQLERPFFVLATQNPIEQEGTYPLPEAQLDRFLLKVQVPYADRAEVTEILNRTTGDKSVQARPVMDATFILAAQALVRRVVVAPHIQDYAVRLVLASHADDPSAPPEAKRWISLGASPRAAQALVSAARVMAIVDGRFAASFDDIRAIAPAALRHRIAASFEAEADRVSPDDLVDLLIRHVPATLDDLGAPVPANRS